MNFPTWMYAKDQPPKLVHGPDEVAQLGADWADVPPVGESAAFVESSQAPTVAAAQSFPAWRYHPTEKARIVRTVDDLLALGEGWYDHPDCGGEFTRFPATIAPAPPPVVPARVKTSKAKA